MYLRLRTALLTLALVALAAPLRLAATPEDDAEAARLYSWANAYINNVHEGDYSYAYIQFYWKRAQSYTDRILRLYPNTPTGRQLALGQLKLGEFDLPYFRDRVLYRLQDKQVAAFDGVYCAIFLYNHDPKRTDDLHSAALESILENLARQKRFNEALKISVLPRDEILKIETVFTVAADYEQNDQVRDMLKVASKAELPRLHVILARALAYRGIARSAIQALIKTDPSDAVKLAVLDGTVIRETAIQRAAALKIAINTVVLEGDSVKNLTTRDDVAAVAKALFPNGNAKADLLLSKYSAGLGTQPDLNADIPSHLAYLDYLALSERYDDLIAYLDQPGLPGLTRNACMLKVIEHLAEAGHTVDAERYVGSYATMGQAASDEANLALFRGQMNSYSNQLIVHADTFAKLAIKDPCVLAQAIMEWSLTPNRSLRGSSPWDQVVYEFAPGFANIPPAKAREISDAASATNPF